MDSRQILTLTTDFGQKDHRLAVLKGHLYQSLPLNVTIVDISHEITPYHLVETAYLFESVVGHYPDHTIHILWVYPGFDDDLLIVKSASFTVVAPDNGLIGMIDFNMPVVIYRVKSDRWAYEIIAHTIRAIFQDDLESIGATMTDQYKQRIALQPVCSRNEIRASFLYADRYGNVVLNVKKPLFDEMKGEKRFEIFYKGMEPITQISEYYSDVTPGEILCMFNEAGYLQISQYVGSAIEALDMNKEDTIQILFYD